MNRKVLLGGLLLVLPVIGLLVMSLGRNPGKVASPLVDREAPQFSLGPVGGGAPVSLASLRGQPVVINFWATWCTPCIAEHGVLHAAARALQGRVHFFGVMYEDEEPKIQEFLRQKGSSYPTLVDPGGRTAIAYGVYGVPETFFVDARGVVRAKFEGALTPEMLETLLAKAGAPVR